MLENSGDPLGFHGILRGFKGILMVFKGISMGFQGISGDFNGIYPLVNVKKKTMGHHHFNGHVQLLC